MPNNLTYAFLQGFLKAAASTGQNVQTKAVVPQNNNTAAAAPVRADLPVSRPRFSPAQSASVDRSIAAGPVTREQFDSSALPVAQRVNNSQPPQAQENIYGMIRRHEGFSNKVYKDTLGHNTIGYGFTGREHMPNGTNSTMNRATAERVLTNNINNVTSGVQRDLGTNEFNSLPEPAKNSLVDLSYQTGSLSEWPKLLEALRNQNYTNAANEITNSKVQRQTPGRNMERFELMRQAGGAVTPYTGAID